MYRVLCGSPTCFPIKYITHYNRLAEFFFVVVVVFLYFPLYTHTLANKLHESRDLRLLFNSVFSALNIRWLPNKYELNE